LNSQPKLAIAYLQGAASIIDFTFCHITLVTC